MINCAYCDLCTSYCGLQSFSGEKRWLLFCSKYAWIYSSVEVKYEVSLSSKNARWNFIMMRIIDVSSICFQESIVAAWYKYVSLVALKLEVFFCFVFL